ncbi:MAG: glycosyltransferase family 2 protein [Acidobacteriia bacterium]|nr:glycosyltransferase family 2 protein [Terriglobia bacterium]
MSRLPVYVLITPARNEAAFIEQTIQSVVAQTARPAKWVIVSDGSTDETDAIVLNYAAQHDWIELVRMPERKERHFAGKVLAFNAGYARVQSVPYELVGNLDGDLSFDEDYYSFLLAKVAADTALGLVGTPFQENDTAPVYDYRFVSIEHVSGCCQLFRRECFEEIGGYVPVEGGGIDHLAVTTARMKGWKTRTFTEKVCRHNRTMGTAQVSLLQARLRQGRKDYAFGYHPLWELFRCVHQMTYKPRILGGLALLYGYLRALLRGEKRPISDELMAFQRREQMQRLKKFFGLGRIFPGKEAALRQPADCASLKSANR